MCSPNFSCLFFVLLYYQQRSFTWSGFCFVFLKFFGRFAFISRFSRGKQDRGGESHSSDSRLVAEFQPWGSTSELTTSSQKLWVSLRQKLMCDFNKFEMIKSESAGDKKQIPRDLKIASTLQTIWKCSKHNHDRVKSGKVFEYLWTDSQNLSGCYAKRFT